MQAAVYRKHGGSDVIQVEETVVPSFGPNDVVVQVYAASLNPVDWKFVDGMFALLEPLLGVRFPQIPGFDVSGVVVAVGQNCHRLRVGDEGGRYF